MRNIAEQNPHCSFTAGGIQFESFWPEGSPLLKVPVGPEGTVGVPKHAHTHFTYEAFFVTGGGLRLVTGKESRSFSRSVVIVPPGLGHYSVPEEAGCYCLLFSFDVTTPEGALLRACLGQGVVVLPLAEDISFYVRRLGEKSEDVTAAARQDAELLTALIFNGITALLLPARRAEESGRESSHIGAIEKYINRHIRHRITLSDVARGVYLSPRQTARIIERAYGKSFSKVIADKRLTAAELMLKNTDMSVAEIAEDAFVGTAAYFYVRFKQKYGVTPLQYRKRHRGEQ